MKQKLLTLTLLATTLWAAPAMARGELQFKDLDLNKDGKISLKEMQSGSLLRFSKADKNNDKIITLQEVLDMMPFFVRDKAKPKVTEYLTARDQNKDGKVSFQEIQNAAEIRFKTIDLDKNGLIDKNEFDNAKDKQF